MNITGTHQGGYPWRSCFGSRDKHNLITFIRKILGQDITDLVNIYEKLASHLIKHEGQTNAAIRLKSLYNVALRHAAGLSYEPIKFCRSSKDGLPKSLREFRASLEGSVDAKRASLTVLQLYKLIPSKGKESFESIIKPYGGIAEPSWLEDFKLELERSFPISKQSERISKLKPGLHISGKNGPNGPAILTSPIDKHAIEGVIDHRQYQMAYLTQNIYLATINDETIGIHNELLSERDIIMGFVDESPTSDRMYTADFDVRPEHDTRELTHSRLRIKYEPGGKARVFAILDWWTQSALQPIHKFLMDWLYDQKQDGTRNHSNAANTVREWTKGTYAKDLWSFDLTTATDRYPRKLEYMTIKQIFGKAIASEWEDLISDRDFTCPDGSKIRFSVGQPLGALSSWAAFAVTHHIHIRTAIRRAKKFAKYRIIGDDIAIAGHPSVAERYQEMMKDLDVPFSESKSILPHQMSKPTIELAKRLFVEGLEITPVPPDAILTGLKTPIGIKDLLEQCLDRGYERAGQVYPVQSILSSQIEWSTLTFPIRNRLPQLNEVKFVLTWWDNHDEDPPCGLHRGWFTWSETPSDHLEWFTREFLLFVVEEARQKGRQAIGDLYEKALIGDFDNCQGGGWKPGPWDYFPRLFPRIMDYMTEHLEEALLDIMTNPNLLESDLYEYIGSLHSYLDPDIVFRPDDFRDEKVKTKVFISNIIKAMESVRRHKDPINALITYFDKRRK